MSTIQIGVDLAKTVFEVAVSTAPGVVQSRRRLSRTAFPRFLATQDSAEVLLEACGSAHHWGRTAQRLGPQVKLLHPTDVARYRDGNKTERADAKALLEAARNQELTPVPVKSVEQQTVVALHRIRQGYLRTRTARINALRGTCGNWDTRFRSGRGGSRWMRVRRWPMRRSPVSCAMRSQSCWRRSGLWKSRESQYAPR